MLVGQISERVLDLPAKGDVDERLAAAKACLSLDRP